MYVLYWSYSGGVQTNTSLCKKTIQNALFAVGKTLESDVELWMKNINKSKYLKFDETDVYDVQQAGICLDMHQR